MPRGRPKKITNTVTKTKKNISQAYNALDFDHTGAAKFNPRNLFEEWGLADIMKEETKIDKKLSKKIKKATPRRPAIKYEKVVCPFCQNVIRITENEKEMYAFTILNDSPLPTFKCDRCMGN